MSEVRPLTPHAIRLLARDQADAFEPCTHYFPKHSEEARAFEEAYLARQLQQQGQQQRTEA